MQLDRREAAETLLKEIVFLDATLTTLKEKIEKEGVIVRVPVGYSKADRENPALKAYNTTVMRYSQLIKQLTDLLPKPTEIHKTDPLIDFIKP
jgi:hypothetical protein